MLNEACEELPNRGRDFFKQLVTIPLAHSVLTVQK